MVVPTARLVSSFPKKAAGTPDWMHRLKLTFAPYWLALVRPSLAQRELPSAGKRLVTEGEENVLVSMEDAVVASSLKNLELETTAAGDAR